MPTAHHLGGRVGPRVAGLVNRAIAENLNLTGHARARIHAEGLNRFYRGIELERKAHARPLQSLFLGHEGTHPAAEQLLSFMANGSGELSSLLAERTLGAGFGAGIGQAISNLLSPVTQSLLYDAPLSIPDASTAAGMAASAILSEGEGIDVIRRSGLNEGWGAHLIEAAHTFPGLPELLELHRRGLINQAEVEHALRRGGLPEFYVASLFNLRRAILAPADLALMQLRGIIDEGTGRAIAAQSGVDAEDFDRLVLATGEPPGLESLLEAFRRGFIDDQRLRRGIRQSRVRDEWTDTVERLRFSPMQTADAVEAVVRNYITPEQGKAIAEQNGLEPQHWQTLLLAHGRPPGHAQMLQLLNRGLVSEAQVDQAVRESDVKDKYVPMLRGLRWRIPAERLIVTMLQHGAISETRAHELLSKDGYEPDVAGAILRTGVAQRTAGHKAVALSQIVELFEGHAIDEAQARKMIEALGYPAADVPLLLEVANLKRELSWRNQAIGAVRAAFLARHVDASEAAAELGALGIPAAQVAYLGRIWAVELRGRRKQLTEAQIVHGLRAGKITEADAHQRLVNIGYHAEDATFLIDTSGPIPKGK